MRGVRHSPNVLRGLRAGFEITGIADTATAGVTKKVAMLAAFEEMTVDFTADQPGSSCG